MKSKHTETKLEDLQQKTKADNKRFAEWMSVLAEVGVIPASHLRIIAFILAPNYVVRRRRSVKTS